MRMTRREEEKENWFEYSPQELAVPAQHWPDYQLRLNETEYQVRVLPVCPLQ